MSLVSRGWERGEVGGGWPWTCLTGGVYAGLRAFSRDVIGMRLPRWFRPPWLLDGAYSWCEGGFNTTHVFVLLWGLV